MSKLQYKGVYSSIPAPHTGQSTPSPAFPPQHRIPTAQRCSDGFYLWMHGLWLSHTLVITPLCFEDLSLMEKPPGSQLVAAVASGGRRRRAGLSVLWSESGAYRRQTRVSCTPKKLWTFWRSVLRVITSVLYFLR